MKSNRENIEYFESIVAEYAGSKYAVAVDCCSHAIYMSLRYLKDIEKIDVPYIEIPKMTYVSVPAMVIHAGYNIRFTDDEWEGLYRLNPLSVVDGACRFTEGMYIPETFHCLSFGSKKILSTGKGGMILTDDSDAVNWLHKIRFAGRDIEKYFDIADIDVLGWHMYMLPETAARGIEEFYSLPKHNKDFGSSDDRLDLSKFTAFKRFCV